MNTKKLLIGWIILTVVLAVAGCRPAPTPAATEEPAIGPAFARDAVDAQGNVSATAVGNADMPNPASVYFEEQGGAVATAVGSADMPNPASVYCEDNGGAVEIRTGADGGQVGVCIFADGSECDEWAFFRGECAPGGAIPPDVVLDQEAAYGGVRFLYNQAIAAGVTGETIAAEELWEVIPEHIAFSFSGYALPAPFHEARIHVYPVGEFTSGGGAANTAVALRSLLDSGQLPPPGGGFDGATISLLPSFNAGQLLHTQVASVNFQNGRGVRFLTEYAQYYAPINNTDLFYTFQGLTDDGQYYVAAILPVAHPSLPADAAQILGGDPDAFANNYETYANDMALQLAAYGAAEFTPSLALLDALIASLQVTP